MQFVRLRRDKGVFSAAAAEFVYCLTRVTLQETGNEAPTKTNVHTTGASRIITVDRV